MRRRTILRESRLVHAAVGATILAGPASAALADPAHDAGAQEANTQTGVAIQARVKSRRLHYGQPVVVSGHATSSEAGQPVALDFVPFRSSAWDQIALGRISGSGSFRLSAPLRTSGQVKVIVGSQPAASTIVVGAAAGDAASTRPQRVTVSAAIRLRPRAREVLGARTVEVRGRLLPRGARRRVLLQARRYGHWITLAKARTRRAGWFALRYLASLPGQEPLRVRFPGDRGNASVATAAGRLTVLHQTLASWYEDGGTTACGFHAHYGVANLSLPCGARVTFSYGGHTVNAVVDDRGPYVGGRQWDLNQNTASALGFGGVGTVWSSS